MDAGVATESLPKPLIKPRRSGRQRLRTRQALLAYTFLLPTLVLMLVFTFYPIVYGVIMSLYNYSIIEPAKWVGLQNFATALRDPIFWISVRNSFLYVLVVPFIQFFSIIMAVIVNRRIRGIQVFRVAYFIPVVTSMVAVAITWGWIYEQHGLLSNLLVGLHILPSPVNWLENITTALPALMLVTMWKGLGYYMMIYLAGLQGIPAEMEEAAAIDGANRLQTILYVTIPLLRPTVVLCSFLSITSAVGVFDEVYVMTGGGPLNNTLTHTLYQYQQAFLDFKFGYAAAMGILVAMVMWVLTMILYRFGGRGGLRYYY